jgi:alpha-methylacyl-CoA racemase
MRIAAPAWDAALNAGKESVVCDLKAEPEFGRSLCASADVVLEGFRPGVAARLGIGREHLPDTVVYCSLTGFGLEGPLAPHAGHDLNYVGYAGVLVDDPSAVPPVQVADLAAGSLTAVAEIVAALFARLRTGRGAHLVISMTHAAHRLVSHRLAGDPLPRYLTGGLACYRIYATKDGRHLTIGALEAKFFRRLCELLGRPELAAQQLDPGSQEQLASELQTVFASRPLAEWLELFEEEDVCAGPVATREEAAAQFGEHHVDSAYAALGAHTEPWRRKLGFWS